MVKVTKKERKAFVRDKLTMDRRWAQRALLVIYSKQTMTEQVEGYTSEVNGVGFSGADSDIMSSFAKFLKKNEYLSPTQMTILHKIIPKYWKQVIDNSDLTKLDKYIK